MTRLAECPPQDRHPFYLQAVAQCRSSQATGPSHTRALGFRTYMHHFLETTTEKGIYAEWSVHDGWSEVWEETGEAGIYENDSERWLVSDLGCWGICWCWFQFNHLSSIKWGKKGTYGEKKLLISLTSKMKWLVCIICFIFLWNVDVCSSIIGLIWISYCWKLFCFSFIHNSASN